MRIATFFFLLLSMLAGCQGATESPCALTKVSQLPLASEGGLLVVPVGINGQWVHLIVDSGAERTTISETTALRLGLRHDSRHATRIVGIGGETATKDVIIERLVMGGVRFPLNRIATGQFSFESAHGINADGLLGADILLAFALDFDVPERTLTLYRNRMCSGLAPPWKQAFVEIQGIRAMKDRLLVPMQFDGVAGFAILDTGAEKDMIGPAMALRMGLTDQVLDHDPRSRTQGVGGVAISRLHRISRLQIGPEVIEKPEILVLPSHFGIGDALLGVEFLRDRRVWVSFKDRRVFVSRSPQAK